MFKEQRPIYIFSYKIKEWCHVVLDVIRSSGPESTNIEYDSLKWSRVRSYMVPSQLVLGQVLSSEPVMS